MKRGAVYLVSLGPAPGRGNGAGPGESTRNILQPVVVVSREAINRHGSIVVVCPLVESMSVQQRYPSDVAVSAPEAGLTVDALVLTAQIRAIPRDGLVRYLGELSREIMQEVDKALRVTLDLEE